VTEEGPGAAVARLTGLAVRDVRPLSADLASVVLDGGQAVLAKRGAGPNAVAAETAGLRWLAEPGEVPIPAVRGADERWLVIDRVTEGAPTPAGAESFGRRLAALHAAGAPAFGAAPPAGPRQAWIGRAPMHNTPGANWPQWYAEHRVLPYVRLAVDDGVLTAPDAAVVERACRRLPELAGPPEPPARLHGDLWSGNVLWDEAGHVWLIDPAAHGGHRETDLAMLHLFGCPHLDRVVAGYQEAAPLAPGWRQRIAAHQLFPLLVHTVLFGGGYADRALAAARSLG
jgi:fructosamine-3-kinase